MRRALGQRIESSCRSSTAMRRSASSLDTLPCSCLRVLATHMLHASPLPPARSHMLCGMEAALGVRFGEQPTKRQGARVKRDSKERNRVTSGGVLPRIASYLGCRAYLACSCPSHPLPHTFVVRRRRVWHMQESVWMQDSVGTLHSLGYMTESCIQTLSSIHDRSEVRHSCMCLAVRSRRVTCALHGVVSRVLHHATTCGVQSAAPRYHLCK